MLESLLREALIEGLLLSVVPLGASCAIGLCIALFQAATQVQEQSVTFLAKFLTIAGVLIAARNWVSAELLRLVTESLAAIQQAGRW